MIKTFYVKTDIENKIRGIMPEPYEDYLPIELDTPVSMNITSGCYELVSGNAVYRREWDTNDFETRLQAQQEVMDDIVIAMLGGESNV